jgi:hypothetical protein
MSLIKKLFSLFGVKSQEEVTSEFIVCTPPAECEEACCGKKCSPKKKPTKQRKRKKARKKK